MWQSIAMVVHALLQVVVIAVLARLISPEEFGVFAIVSVLTAFVLFISEAGFGPSLIYQRTLTAGHVNAAFTSTIVLSFLFAIGLWISAPQLGIRRGEIGFMRRKFFSGRLDFLLLTAVAFSWPVANAMTEVIRLFAPRRVLRIRPTDRGLDTY